MIHTKWFRYLFSSIVLLLIWQFGSVLLNTRLLPEPWQVLVQISVEMQTVPFWRDTGTSFLRITIGLIVAFITAVPAGLLIGGSRRLDRIFEPAVSIIYPIPKIVLLPLILLLFGLGSISKIVLIALIIFFQLLLPVRDTARQIEAEAIMSFRSLGGSRRQFLWHVILPGSLPGIFTALRLGTGTAVAVLFFAESLSARSGLGLYILNAWGRSDHVSMFAGMVMLSLLGVFFYELFSILERKACPWKHLS